MIPWVALSAQQTPLGFEGRCLWPLSWRNRRSCLDTWLQWHPYRAIGNYAFSRQQGRNDRCRLTLSWVCCPPGYVAKTKYLRFSYIIIAALFKFTDLILPPLLRHSHCCLPQLPQTLPRPQNLQPPRLSPRMTAPRTRSEKVLKIMHVSHKLDFWNSLIFLYLLKVQEHSLSISRTISWSRSSGVLPPVSSTECLIVRAGCICSHSDLNWCSCSL